MEGIVVKNEYDREFQQFLIEHAMKSAKEIMPYIQEILHPKSIVDFGCGTGTWLKVAKDLWGGGRNYIERDLLMIQKDEFIATDLTKPVTLERKYDLAMSLEVAEHIDSVYADIFIESICKASDVIFFSAALQGQWGVHHVNEQRLSYWVEKFEKNGFQCFDIIRPRFWYNKNVDLDYRQNCVIFAKKSRDNSDIEKYEGKIMDIAHPEFLEGRTKAWRYWMDKVEYIQEKHKVIAWILRKVWKRYKKIRL